MDVRQVARRDRQPDRLGAGCEQQPIVESLAPPASATSRALVSMPATAAAAADRCRSPHRNSQGAAAPSPPARCRRDNPWRDSAGPPAAHRRRSASRCCPVVLARSISAAAKPGRAAADDDDLLRAVPALAARLWLPAARAFRARRSCRRAARPSRTQRVQGRSAQRFAGAQVETGVMPRTADGVVGDEAFDERSVVVRAVRTDGENLRPWRTSSTSSSPTWPTSLPSCNAPGSTPCVRSGPLG